MATRATHKPEQGIAALADELEQLAAGFERARDPRCVFALAYARLSRELATALPSAGFVDPAWIARLARVFGDYYLRALRGYDAGTLAPGAWKTVFDASTHADTTVLEELVLGMTAHIVHDLPLALNDVGLATPSGASRIADYHRLNAVLGKAVAAIQAELSRRYQPVLFVLDQLFEDYDEILTNYGLRISRATAWYNALRLLDPFCREAALAAITRAPAVTRDELLEPPFMSLRFALRKARLLSRLSRRWPEAARAARGSAGSRDAERVLAALPGLP